MTMPEFSRLAYLGDLTSDQLDEEARRLVGEVDDLRDTISLLSQACRAALHDHDAGNMSDGHTVNLLTAAILKIDDVRSPICELMAPTIRALKGSAPYGEMCRDPNLCVGKGYCPRDPTCGD